MIIRDLGGTYGERSRGVTGGSPASTTVKTHALVGNNLEEATATEGLGVSLTLNLENIQREKDDLSNADQTKRIRIFLTLSAQFGLTFQQRRA
jgi:hypothetical protein